MASVDEVIEFKQPDGVENTLYIYGMKGRYDEIELAAKLRGVFSHFGLLYDVLVMRSKLTTLIGTAEDEQHPIICYYAFVKYYSSAAATKAKYIMHGRTLMNDGQTIIVKLAVFKKVVNANQYYLGLNKCQELANYYLGFNSWCSTITSMMEDCDFDETCGDKMRYMCICKLAIPSYGVESQGIGIGESQYKTKDMLSKAQAIGYAKKHAYRRACENAFGRLILVTLDNGKVAVEVNNIKADLLTCMDDADNMDGVVQVNHIEDVVVEDADKENYSPLAVDDLDDINAQILLDLEHDY